MHHADADAMSLTEERKQKMADVLINHPHFGSLWLENAEVIKVEGRAYVVGNAWDDSDVGSAYLPDDYSGEPVTPNFPVSCIRKDPEGLVDKRTELKD